MAALLPRDGVAVMHCRVSQADPWLTYGRIAVRGALAAAIAGAASHVLLAPAAVAILAALATVVALVLARDHAARTATPFLAMAFTAVAALGCVGLSLTLSLPGAMLLVFVLALAWRP